MRRMDKLALGMAMMLAAAENDAFGAPQRRTSEPVSTKGNPSDIYQNRLKLAQSQHVFTINGVKIQAENLKKAKIKYQKLYGKK